MIFNINSTHGHTGSLLVIIIPDVTTELGARQTLVSGPCDSRGDHRTGRAPRVPMLRMAGCSAARHSSQKD